MSDLAVVLVSGGMDSLLTLAMAKKKHEKLAFLHLNYGQKTSLKEKQCFDQIANHYQIPEKLRKVICLDFLKEIGGSSLTDQDIEVSDYQGDQNNIPSSYVPFRNSIILSLATSWAEAIGAKHLYIGANEEDSPGYPDCRPNYYRAFQELINQGSKKGDILIHTPVISMTKKEIVQKGIQLKVPFEKSWSCYKNDDLACGICDSCQLRLRGFKQAGQTDPLKYGIGR